MIGRGLDKKGQIAKLISSFPIMLLVFIIMGVFIFISSTVSLASNKVTPVFSEEIVTQDDLMAKEIIVNLGEGKDREQQILIGDKSQSMLVLEAVTKYVKNEITKQALCSSLKPLVPVGSTGVLYLLVSENPGIDASIPTCRIISGKKDGKPYYNAEVGDRELTLYYIGEEKNVVNLLSFTANGKRYYVEYYMGRN